MMLQVTPRMKILVAIEPADFRRGIDGLAQLCQGALRHDPFAGAVFVFRNRKATALKLLMYDGQGSGSAISGSRGAGSRGGRPPPAAASSGWPRIGPLAPVAGLARCAADDVHVFGIESTTRERAN
jgi:hypothetical protein